MEGWDDILNDGEHLIWQGQPDARVRFDGPTLPFVFFGAVFVFFALHWTISTLQEGGVWAFGMFQLFAGLGAIWAALFLGPLLARRTWYSLTNRRAFFASDLPFAGKTLAAIDLRPSLGVSYDGKRLGTILFQGRAKSLVGQIAETTPSFSKLPDARHVYGLIRDIQKGTA